MLLPWLTWAALLAAASAADATPEELLLLETQSTALPHRLLQLLTTGQLQQRQRRLRQSAGFKPWSGKRSGSPNVIRDEPTSGETEDKVYSWPDKRGSFKPWTGKRNGFKPWVGKRSAFKPWTGKRDSFKPWTGKRESFKSWKSKRDSFKPWTGKRDSFKPWTGKRQGYKPWSGKRDPANSWTGTRGDPNTSIETRDASEAQIPRKSDIVQMLEQMEDFAKRAAARDSKQEEQRQSRHVVRQRFKPWSGKRSFKADDTTEDDDRIQF